MPFPQNTATRPSRLLLCLAIACVFWSLHGTEIRIDENLLKAREKTSASSAYQFQQSPDLVHWQNIGALHKGDGSIIEIDIPLPDNHPSQIFIRAFRSDIWAPQQISIDFIKRLGEYTEADGEIEFLPGDEDKIVMTLKEIQDDETFDASIYSTITWTLDETDFNHATFTLTIDRVVYRSPFSASYTIQELADVSGEDPPHRIVSDLYYTGEDEGNYSTKFYLLSGALAEQSSGPIGTLFP